MIAKTKQFKTLNCEVQEECLEDNDCYNENHQLPFKQFERQDYEHAGKTKKKQLIDKYMSPKTL